MFASKLPLLVSSTLAFYVGLTPPHKPTSDDVLMKPTPTEQVMSIIAGYTTPILRILYLAGGSTEIAAILAKRVDPTHVPQILHSALHMLRTLKDTPVTPTFIFGASLITFGGILRWFCYRAMGRHFTYVITKRKNHQLITSGPYAWVRHPSYTGSIAMIAGAWAISFADRSFLRVSGVSEYPGVKAVAVSWLLLMTFANTALFKRMRLEDEMMRENFGEEWDRWASRVKYQLIPGIY